MPYYDLQGLGAELVYAGDDWEEDEDYSGADLEILGALARSPSRSIARAAQGALSRARSLPRVASRPAAPRAAMSPVVPATVVQASNPTKSRRLVLPIDTGAVAIAPGAPVTVNLQPSQVFRATQMRLDPVASPNFLITDIKVGRKSQFLGAGSVPATVFNANNPDCAVSFDTAQATETIQLLLTNMSGAAARLTGALVGETIE